MKHTCHIPHCDLEISTSQLMCRRHWTMLPKPMQKRVWESYRKGQEDTKDPSSSWLRVAREAIDYVVVVDNRGRS